MQHTFRLRHYCFVMLAIMSATMPLIQARDCLMPSGVVGKNWDRSRDVMFRNERKNSNLGKTAVVEFAGSLYIHCLLANS